MLTIFQQARANINILHLGFAGIAATAYLFEKYSGCDAVKSAEASISVLLCLNMAAFVAHWLLECHENSENKDNYDELEQIIVDAGTHYVNM